MKRSLRLPISCALAALAASATGHAQLIAHYTFDVDGSATVGTDAVLGSAASVVPDAVVGAGSLFLSGAPATDTAGDDGAVSGNTFDWSLGDTRTVAFWMKATAGDHGDDWSTMLSLGSGFGAGNRFDVRLEGDALRVEVQSGGTTTGVIAADGTWHHIAVVAVDPATVADCLYYVDGVPQGPLGGATTALDTLPGPLRVGDSYQDMGRDFKGNLDDVRLYDTALSDAEIAALATLEPGAGFCFGDGGATSCPCGNDNDGSVPGSGCANGAHASGAQLVASGTASLSADTLVFAGTNAVPNQPGLYFQGDNDLSPGLIFGDGLRCAGASVVRLGIRSADVNGDSDTSSWTTPISVLAGNITAGDTKRYQLWYRDPFTSPCGSLFNLSNGYAITWAP